MRNRDRAEDARHFLALLMGIAFIAAWLVNEGSTAGVHIAAIETLTTGWISTGLALLSVILANSLFVASEAAVLLLKPMHVRHVRETDPARGERLQKLIDSRMRYLASCKLGSDMARLVIMLLVLVLAPGVAQFASTQFGWAPTYLNTLLVAVALMVPIGFVNLIAELVPKSYATLHPHGVAAKLSGFIRASSLLLSIPASAITGLANVFTTRFGGTASFTLANQAEEEIKTLVETAQEAGEIEQDERELLHSVFEFTDTVAREVMTPRVDVDSMPVDSAAEDVMDLIKTSGHSRIPLYEGTDDRIVGIVHAKDLLMAMLSGDSPDLRDLMRPATCVPENKNLHELLSEMRSGRSQLAVVQDEFGGTAGIVTIEDIVEELVGDIVDEYDVEESEIVESGTGWVIEGKAHIDDVNEEIGTDFQSEEFDTVGGMVFGLFGRQPKLGEEIELGAYRFRIEETDGRRIHKVFVERSASAAISKAEPG